jgi:hypothetical protein
MWRGPEGALQRGGGHQQEDHGYHEEGGDGALGPELGKKESAERRPEGQRAKCQKPVNAHHPGQHRVGVTDHERVHFYVAQRAGQSHDRHHSGHDQEGEAAPEPQNYEHHGPDPHLDLK